MAEERRKKKIYGSGWQRAILLLSLLKTPRTINEIAKDLGLSLRGAYRAIKGIEKAGVIIYRSEIERGYKRKLSEEERTHYCLFDPCCQPVDIMFCFPDGRISGSNSAAYIFAFMRQQGE